MKQLIKLLLTKVLSLVDLFRNKLAIVVISMDSEDIKFNTVKRYRFDGKEFDCDELTISKLNFALAKNNAKERYIEIG